MDLLEIMILVIVGIVDVAILRYFILKRRKISDETIGVEA